MSSPRQHRGRFVLAVAFAALLMLAPACAKKYAAEKDGKDAGQSLCDVKQADTPEEAQSAAADLKKQLDDINENYLSFTAEDRKDIEEQLSDLIQHRGDDLLAQQDLAVLRRSLENIKNDLGEAGQATIDGFFEGLDDCDGN